MKTIWRQGIEITDEQYVTGPGLNQVLSVDNARAFGPEVWFDVDTDEPAFRVKLWIVGTGHPVPVECRRHGYYVGHFYAIRQSFVGHVYASQVHEDAP